MSDRFKPAFGRLASWSCWWLVVVIDQLSKLVVSQVQPSVLTHNPGISFGWLPGNTGAIVFSTVLIGGIVWWWQSVQDRSPSGWPNLGIQLLLGGAISNLLDRIIWGGVRDWLPIPFTALSNNLADWAIAVGVVLLLFSQLRYHTVQHAVKR